MHKKSGENTDTIECKKQVLCCKKDAQNALKMQKMHKKC